jgi:GxxExxY protein
MPRKRKESTVEALLRHARGVMRVLGKGHTERVYHRAMITSLNREMVPHRSEVLAPIYFMREVVGFGRCDIVVGSLAVEFKANSRCPSKTSPQLQKYLESLKASERTRFRGVVINFNQRHGKIDIHYERAAARRRVTSC